MGCKGRTMSENMREMMICDMTTVISRFSIVIPHVTRTVLLPEATVGVMPDALVLAGRLPPPPFEGFVVCAWRMFRAAAGFEPLPLMAGLGVVAMPGVTGTGGDSATMRCT